MKNKHEEKAKISFIFYYINRLKELLPEPPLGLFNILVTFNTLCSTEKDLLDLTHEITIANYYFDLVLSIKGLFLFRKRNLY